MPAAAIAATASLRPVRPAGEGAEVSGPFGDIKNFRSNPRRPRAVIPGIGERRGR